MKKKVGLLVLALLCVAQLSGPIVQALQNGSDNKKAETEVISNKEKKEDTKEKKEDTKEKKEGTKGKKEDPEEKEEDLIYNVVVAKNGSITSDRISEKTYNELLELLEAERKNGNTYKNIDQDNIIVLHDGYGYKLNKSLEKKIMSKYSTKLPHTQVLFKDNKVSEKEATQRNNKILVLGILVWLSLNKVPAINEIVRKERY